MKPGQGFKRGNLISFMALPWPLPLAAQRNLQEVAKELRHHRLMLESSPASKTIRQDYAESVRVMDQIENSLRSTVGEQETRPEFLSLSFKPTF